MNFTVVFICLTLIPINLAFSLDVKDIVSKKLDLLSEYIPFSQTEDNCFYRRDYMALEMLQSGVDLYEVYIVNQDDELMLSSSGDKWKFHTTIGIEVRNEIFVMDPSFSDKLMTFSEWKNEVNTESNKSKIVYSEKNNQIDETTGDCIKNKYKNPYRKHEETAFSFVSDNFPIMCAYMLTDIKKESISSFEKNKKINKLIKRSKDLLIFALEEGLTEIDPKDLNVKTNRTIIDLESICREGIASK